MDSTYDRPPFFGPSFPTYPLIAEVMRVDGAADANGVSPASIVQYTEVPGTPVFRERVSVWVYDPNGGSLGQGSYVSGRLVGSYPPGSSGGSAGGSSAGPQLPLYAVASGGDARLQVQITSWTAPSPNDPPFILYHCSLVVDSQSPNALTFTTGAAGPDFYSLNDIALPIGLVCWIRRSQNGTWYLNDNDTRVDIIKKGSTLVVGTTNQYQSTLERWNGTTLEDQVACILFDINAP